MNAEECSKNDKSPIFERGFVVFENGKILAVGEDFNKYLTDTNDVFDKENIIDADGQYVLPGFVDPHSHIGMWEDGVGFEGDDGNDSVDSVTPHLRAIDAIFHADNCFDEAMRAGVTTVCTGPGSANVLNGQFVSMKTHGRCVEEMVFNEFAALKVALGENPKVIHSEKKQSPSTRMSIAAEFRAVFKRGEEYIKKWEEYNSNPDDNECPEYDYGLEAIAKALKKEVPVKIHAHRSDDILTGIRLANEFDLNFTIEHCTEGYLIADLLKEKNVSAILGPIICDRAKIELRNLSISNPAILRENGVDFAIMTDHSCVPEQYLPLSAAIAVKGGLDRDYALRAITINAAKLIGADNQVGSLEVGKDADIVIFNGDPLDLMTEATRVFINGISVYEK